VRPEDLDGLSDYSAELGGDPEQVQAAGGNTSLKKAGVLWVKASGLWLADALTRDIFVPVALGPVQDGITADAPDPVSGAVVGSLNPKGLRPSIETTLHALLPHRVVVHTHSVRTIALAVREDGQACMAERLAGMRWAWVPYCKPGLPLTRMVAAALRHGPADILVLGNHGLVVGADDVSTAAALIREVEARLDGPRRRLEPPTAAPPVPGGHRLPHHALVHTLALDPQCQERACSGSLYPDHVIFLGPAAGGRASKLHLLPGAGALLAAGTEASADELALCLALLLERVPPEAQLRYLTTADEAELMNWDAEQYRQALAHSLGR
jgi:rhamnose utilization protein RhaD (predicted bifunctional aldolase and dehydrogenase)